MKSKFIYFILIFCSIFLNAQNEFITIWKPSNLSAQNVSGGTPSTATQIWFPGIGNNFNVSWEEVGYPSHNGTLSNITSTVNFLIDFGSPLNPTATDATYKVKVSNGAGTFNRIKFFNLITYFGDTDKIINIEQWGNIVWQDMEYAFARCTKLNMIATDIPNLSIATSLKFMFHECLTFIGNSSINNWDISNITDIGWMFHYDSFFNQPLNNWNTSNVTKMDHIFHSCLTFNQPLNNWDTGNVTNMEFLFAGAKNFNQNISNWNVSNLSNANSLFQNATDFNQNLGDWNLNSLQTANYMLANSGLDCANYDATLIGWSSNPTTPNNINLNLVTNLIYANANAVAARNNLLNNKGWTFSGDQFDPNCETRLSTSEISELYSLIIFPNPAAYYLNIKSNLKIIEANIVDVSGRILLKIKNPSSQINIAQLQPGNYILNVKTNEGQKSIKFIKK